MNNQNHSAASDAAPISNVYTIQEICEKFKISPSTVHRNVAAGKLRKVKIGTKSTRFLASDVAAWIDGGRK